MKRFFAIVFAGCLILCIFTACQNNPNPAEETTKNDNVITSGAESTSEPRNTDSNKPGETTTFNKDSITVGNKENGFGVVEDWNNGTVIVPN